MKPDHRTIVQPGEVVPRSQMNSLDGLGYDLDRGFDLLFRVGVVSALCGLALLGLWWLFSVCPRLWLAAAAVPVVLLVRRSEAKAADAARAAAAAKRGPLVSLDSLPYHPRITKP